MRPHVNMSTSCRHVAISPCLRLQLVTEAPMAIGIRDSVCENAVTGLWGSCRLLVMGS